MPNRAVNYVDVFDDIANKRDAWIQKRKGFYQDDYKYMKFLVPEGARVLDLGCGTGNLLEALKPSVGVGVDFSSNMIRVGKEKRGQFQFHIGNVESSEVMKNLAADGPYDYIILSDLLGYLEDIQSVLSDLKTLMTPETRVVISYFSPLWLPILNLSTKLGLRMKLPKVNTLTLPDIVNMLDLSKLEVIKTERRQLFPLSFFGIEKFINGFIGPLPLIRNLSLRNYAVARLAPDVKPKGLSVSVLIPCRNEKGNIEPAIERMSRFATDMEILYVEGNSSDGTYEECLRVQEKYKNEWNIVVAQQDGKGKGDAVIKGFDLASKDVLMILDADLTMPPEMLPRFYDIINTGKGEFVMGTRLVYPMEKEAMKPLNYLGNRFFASVFSFILNQRFTDTLCGTKVLTKASYERIKENRSYFGDFDPFGDFDLIFGASKQNLKIVEIPVRYAARTYGSTQISRFRDGWILIKMVAFSWLKLKAI